MIGPAVLAATLSQRRQLGKFPLLVNYNSRSDHHSKVACWGIVVDLLLSCEPMRRHAASGDIIFGINHEMRDFVQNRKKNLDLVIATPNGGTGKQQPGTLLGLGAEHGVVMDDAQRRQVLALPELIRAPVGAVRVAVEAKAAMTAFGKAQPRLFDELNSSQATIHGTSTYALAVGLVMVNTADTFMSTVSNAHLIKHPGTPVEISVHQQPRDALGIIAKVSQLPRRVRHDDVGFDGLAIVPVSCTNLPAPSTSRFELINDEPYRSAAAGFEYRAMINRIAAEYANRYGTR